MEKQTVTIDLERYEELVKKEAIFDKLMDGKGVEFYLTTLKTQSMSLSKIASFFTSSS